MRSRVVIYLEQQQSTSDKSKQSLPRPQRRDFERWPLRPVVVKRGAELLTYFV